MENISKEYVTYEEFGAKGDGVTDDIEAIKAAHDYANEHNVNVRTNPHATYYIGPRPITVTIKTAVDWSTTKFIIDDSKVTLEDRGARVFAVRSNYEPIDFSIPSLKKNQMRLEGVSFPRNCYVRVENAEKKQFIRYGNNQTNGSNQVDSFIVDKTGYILNPVIWNFEKVTKAIACPIDETVLTISGGIFTTIANQAESKLNYHTRGILITRSNVIVEKITHKIVGELDHGAPYGGFITIWGCAYVTLRDSFLTGRKIYWAQGSAGNPVPAGSYGLSITHAVNIHVENLRQNGIMDNTRWGIMCTDHCRDLYFDNCIMSRFDVHENVVNLTIRNTILGHQCFNAIGHGNMVVDNVTAYGNSFLNLRFDYGNSWDGDVIFRNCTWYPAANNASPSFIGVNNYVKNEMGFGGHDFGFPCYMPHRITIENLHICDSCGPENYRGAQIFNVSANAMNSDKRLDFNDNSVLFPYFFAECLYMKNVTCDSGKGIRLFSNETKYCYALKRNKTADGKPRPNFRAVIEDTMLSGESIIPETVLGPEDFDGTYHVVPRIELHNCTNVVFDAVKTPAVLKIVDCEVVKCEENGIASVSISN